MKKLLIRLPQPLLLRLKEEAQEQSKLEGRFISVAKLIRRAVRQSLDDEGGRNEKDQTD